MTTSSPIAIVHSVIFTTFGVMHWICCVQSFRHFQCKTIRHVNEYPTQCTNLETPGHTQSMIAYMIFLSISGNFSEKLHALLDVTISLCPVGEESFTSNNDVTKWKKVYWPWFFSSRFIKAAFKFHYFTMSFLLNQSIQQSRVPTLMKTKY